MLAFLEEWTQGPHKDRPEVKAVVAQVRRYLRDSPRPDSSKVT